ncbi:hypothetical protein [Flavobacterium sp. ZB4P13]|uniref:hypothetical protein n=1 Tax=Flavobacterium sp. ZB4P13 TaxID=3401728 RepID=UPI003AAA8682
MKQFLNLFFGTKDVPTYMAGLLFALIGLAFYYKGKISKRRKTSTSTPYRFSLWFFTQDNLVELVFSILAIFLALRFSVEYAGVEITMFYALGIGFGLPKFIGWLYKVQGKARQ